MTTAKAYLGSEDDDHSVDEHLVISPPSSPPLSEQFVNIPCHKRTANLAFEDPKKATSLYAVDPETGKKKMNIEFIEDRPKRNITFSKRKAGIMKKAFELSTLTGSEVLVLVASEGGHIFSFGSQKFQPMITQPEGKNLIQKCLNAQPLESAPAQIPAGDIFLEERQQQHRKRDFQQLGENMQQKQLKMQDEHDAQHLLERNDLIRRLSLAIAVPILGQSSLMPDPPSACHGLFAVPASLESLTNNGASGILSSQPTLQPLFSPSSALSQTHAAPTLEPSSLAPLLNVDNSHQLAAFRQLQASLPLSSLGIPNMFAPADTPRPDSSQGIPTHSYWNLPFKPQTDT